MARRCYRAGRKLLHDFVHQGTKLSLHRRVLIEQIRELAGIPISVIAAAATVWPANCASVISTSPGIRATPAIGNPG